MHDIPSFLLSAGEWQWIRLVVRGHHFTGYLDGVKRVEASTALHASDTAVGWGVNLAGNTDPTDTADEFALVRL